MTLTLQNCNGSFSRASRSRRVTRPETRLGYANMVRTCIHCVDRSRAYTLLGLAFDLGYLGDLISKIFPVHSPWKSCRCPQPYSITLIIHVLLQILLAVVHVLLQILHAVVHVLLQILHAVVHVLLQILHAVVHVLLQILHALVHVLLQILHAVVYVLLQILHALVHVLLQILHA